MQDDINYQTRKIRELSALSDLSMHIAQPCSPDLMRSYLNRLRTIVENTPFDNVRDAGSAMLTRGEEDYQRLLKQDKAN